MRLERLGLELRMELTPEEPRMIGCLDNLHIILIRRASGNFQSRGHQRFLEVAVEFVAMAVAFADSQLAVSLVRSEEHTSELQSRVELVCRLLLEKKKRS